MEYRVTFGQKYRREPHPVLGSVSPDGWLAVDADDEDTARRQVRDVLGEAWCGLYPNTLDSEADWRGYYPLGEIGRIVDGVVVR